MPPASLTGLGDSLGFSPLRGLTLLSLSSPNCDIDTECFSFDDDDDDEEDDGGEEEEEGFEDDEVDEDLL